MWERCARNSRSIPLENSLEWQVISNEMMHPENASAVAHRMVRTESDCKRPSWYKDPQLNVFPLILFSFTLQIGDNYRRVTKDREIALANSVANCLTALQMEEERLGNKQSMDEWMKVRQERMPCSCYWTNLVRPFRSFSSFSVLFKWQIKPRKYQPFSLSQSITENEDGDAFEMPGRDTNDGNQVVIGGEPYFQDLVARVFFGGEREALGGTTIRQLITASVLVSNKRSRSSEMDDRAKEGANGMALKLNFPICSCVPFWSIVLICPRTRSRHCSSTAKSASRNLWMRS